MKLDASGGVHP